MKLDKEQQKQLINEIYAASRRRGYKKRSNTIYKIDNNALIHCDFLVVNSQKLVYLINIKHYDYDDIFWKIMQMPTNSKEAVSLRAVGAFKAPSIILKMEEIELTDNYKEHAEYLAELVDECSRNFMERYDIDEYIIKCENGMNRNILKCLAYIHMNNIEQAVKIAKNAIKDGDSGGFMNEGKTFFEWMLDIKGGIVSPKDLSDHISCNN